MSFIQTADLKSLQSAFSARFQAGYGSASPVADMISVTQAGDAASMTFGFVAALDVLRPFTGEKELKNLDTHSVLVQSMEYELTLELKKKDIETDQLGLVANRAEVLGRSAAMWKDYLVADCLTDISGTGAGTLTRARGIDPVFPGYGLGFDGVALFSAAHPLDPAGSQSNNFENSALTQANIDTVAEAMRAYTDEGGNPLGVRPDTIIVPPALEMAAIRATQAEISLDPGGAAGTTNIHAMVKRFRVVVLDFLTDATAWYMADMSKAPAAAGVVFYERKAPTQLQLAEGSDYAFTRMAHLFGVEASGAPAPALWWLIARSDA